MMAEQGLKDKTVKGTIWSGIDNVAQFGVSFLVGIVLARLLSPDDYGLIGIITIFTSVCSVIVNSGFSTALLRKKDLDDEDYNTAFAINLLLSVILYLIIYFCAPLISQFFGRTELTMLTRVTSLTIVIGALSIVQQTRLTRKIDFKSQTKITLLAASFSGCLGIIMAIVGCGVWSLVAQTLSIQILRTTSLVFYNKWIPSMSFNGERFKYLFGFGWKLMVAGVLDRLWTQMYQVIIGKFYTPATLGQYTRANHFSMLFSENLTNVIQRVTFPVLSSIQDEKERLISAYRRIIKLTMFVTFLLMLGLAAISEPLVCCLIGSKWSEAAHYLPYLCVIGASYPLHAINLNMLQIQGRSDLFLFLEIIKKIIYLAPLVMGALVGIYPMLYASIFASFVCYFLNSYYSGKILGYSSWAQLRDILPSLVVALMVVVPIYFLKYINLSYWIILPLQLMAGGTLFFVLCELFNVEEYEEIKIILNDYFNKIWKKN